MKNKVRFIQIATNTYGREQFIASKARLEERLSHKQKIDKLLKAATLHKNTLIFTIVKLLSHRDLKVRELTSTFLLSKTGKDLQRILSVGLGPGTPHVLQGPDEQSGDSEETQNKIGNQQPKEEVLITRTLHKARGLLIHLGRERELILKIKLIRKDQRESILEEQPLLKEVKEEFASKRAEELMRRVPDYILLAVIGDGKKEIVVGFAEAVETFKEIGREEMRYFGPSYYFVKGNFGILE